MAITDFEKIDEIRKNLYSNNDDDSPEKSSPEDDFEEIEEKENEEEEKVQALSNTFQGIFGISPTFNGEKGDDFPFHLVSETGKDYPTLPKYYPDPSALTQIALGLSMGFKILMVGPPGCGKTEMGNFIASKLKLPFFRFNFRGDMTPDEILGRVEVVAEDGVPVTKGEMGEFVKRVQEPSVILCDEIMRMHPATAMALQPLFEKNGEMRLQHMKGDVVIKKHPECHILLADNTHGTGDGIDKFSSNSQDQAFLNRIEMTIQMTYPSKDDEIKMIKDYAPKIKKPLANKMVQLGQVMRQSWENDEVSLPFTPRTLHTFAVVTNTFKNPKMGWEMAYVASLPDEAERLHAQQAFFSIFGSSY